jgi:phosphoglycerate dehydrogenase-like enzyme
VIRGIDGVQFSEFAMGAILAWAKRFPHFFKVQQEKRWEIAMPLEISGMTLGILGLGAIGSEVARKAKAFGMRVLGIKRTMTPKPDFVDELWTPDRLPDLLSQSDFFVISTPSSPETFGLLSPEKLKLMKKTACLINLTGGHMIEEEHMVQALREGWIAGAALDAFPRQPLPADSALWALPNVIITPRIGGFTPQRWKRLIPVFVENLKKFVSGQPVDLVDKKLGF